MPHMKHGMSHMKLHLSCLLSRNGFYLVKIVYDASYVISTREKSYMKHDMPHMKSHMSHMKHDMSYIKLQTHRQVQIVFRISLGSAFLPVKSLNWAAA